LAENYHVIELAGFWNGRDLTWSAGQDTPAPLSSSPLTSCVLSGDRPRVYYLAENYHVIELGWDRQWGWYPCGPDISAMPRAAAGSGLTCYAENDKPHVYYLNQDNDVIEAQWAYLHNGWGWYLGRIGVDAGAPRAAAGSALTCYADKDGRAHVYYLDQANNVIELQWDNHWFFTLIGENAKAPQAAAGSALTCYADKDGRAHVYYLDQTNNVIELQWDNHWFCTRIGTDTGAPQAAAGSALTCYADKDGRAHVYYLDQANNVIELQWDNHWFFTLIGENAKAPQAAAGSALTCYAAGGTLAHVYYLNCTNKVTELSWSGQWDWREIYVDQTLGGRPPVPADQSHLTCYATDAPFPHVYYFDTSNNVNELAWDPNNHLWLYNPIASQADRSAGRSPRPAPQAVPGSALTCYAYKDVAHVYYFDTSTGPTSATPPPRVSNRVSQLAWDNPGHDNNWFWVWTPIGQDDGAPQAAAGSGLTCYGDNDGKAHIYYLDQTSNVIELQLVDPNNRRWVANCIGQDARAPQAAAGSALTCYADNDGKAHIYYLDQTSNVIELRWDDPVHRWVSDTIGKNAGAPQATAGSALTCYAYKDVAHIYYLDQTSNVIELQLVDPNNRRWVSTRMGERTVVRPPQAAAGSGLTCYGENDGKAHVYYVAQTNEVIEMQWIDSPFPGRWGWTSLGEIAGAQASVGSALTCYADGDTIVRVYYEAPDPRQPADQMIHQLARTGLGWVDGVP
jgi:hypothetical protein